MNWGEETRSRKIPEEPVDRARNRRNMDKVGSVGVESGEILLVDGLGEPQRGRSEQ